MIRQLTKRKRKSRALYARPPDIEAQIALAVTQDLTALRQRLRVINRELPDYLRTETLIYLIRDAFRAHDDALRDTVIVELLRRCEAILQSTVSHALPNPEDIREQILSDFAQLLASDAADPSSQELDYFECRFARAFRSLRIGRMRSEVGQVNRIAESPDDTDPLEADSEGIVGTAALQLIPTALHETLTPETLVHRQMLQAAIDRLPAAERDAFALVELLGYDEEADDPDKETAATRCHCTGRTIRNRLKSAKRALATMLLKEDV